MASTITQGESIIYEFVQAYGGFYYESPEQAWSHADLITDVDAAIIHSDWAGEIELTVRDDHYVITGVYYPTESTSATIPENRVKVTDLDKVTRMTWHIEEALFLLSYQDDPNACQ